MMGLSNRGVASSSPIIDRTYSVTVLPTSLMEYDCELKISVYIH